MSTTMHFGPEWMRTKPQPTARNQPPPSPPHAPAVVLTPSTYSSLLTTSTAPPVETKDEAHPFRYSREEMLRIYREGGGKGGLGLEVERWEGVVRETGSDPIGLKEMGEVEKKLFSTPLNSDLRRRQSSDFLNLNTQNLERPRLNHANTASAAQSPLRERFGTLMTRRRDSADPPPLAPRKLSLTGQPPLQSPRESGMPSPRGRLGHTPGFDGVLNGGDSWVARRRASEGIINQSGNSARDPGEDPKELEIKEEDEENHPGSQPKSNSQHHSIHLQSSLTGGIAPDRPEIVESAITQMTIDVPIHNAQSVTSSPASTSASIGPPPGIDLAGVEWSYLDPQGHVQGPFKADIMQKWSDDGYFTDGLLMKRTNIDNDWITVGELKRRVGNTNKVFLTPISVHVPPGLIRRSDSPFSYANSNESAYHNGPFQPSPIRSLRSSTLESFSSNYSESPASSFGATGRFGNGSPETSAFGVRPAQYPGGGLAGYSLNTGEGSPSISGRPGFAIPSNDYRPPAFGNLAGARGSSLDINAGLGMPASTWPTNFENGRGSNDPMVYQSGFTATAGTSSPFVSTNGFQGSVGVSSLGTSGIGFEQFSPSPLAQFNVSTSHQTIPDIFDQQQQQTPVRIDPLPIETSVPAPPWGSLISPINKRSVPSDSALQNNVAVNNQSPWGIERLSRSSSQANDVPPWPSPTPVVADGWHPTQTVSPDAVVQQKQEGELLREGAVEVATEIVPDSTPIVPEPPVVAPEPVEVTPTTVSASKTRVKSGSQQGAPTLKASIADPLPIAPETLEAQPLIPATTVSKAPWAKEDESKKAATSLRKIQDAEAKRAEVRKAAEREKERAARVSQPTPAPGEEVQPFTASWGLPTSKAGKSSSALVTPKEVPSPVPASAAGTPPVWSTTTAAAVPAKKTMKEIQEEEEKRKKTAAKDNVVNSASRRGYAESTSKSSVVHIPATASNAWTTVGPSGKQTLAGIATVASTRPPVTPSPTTASSSSTVRVNGAASRPAPIPTSKVSVPSTKVDDFPIAPSTEFLKWLAEALKGLNSSVNVEDIMSMILSFPLDPDPSTSEIISDLIYANSTTLDGRRFAADFLSRRKTDAVARAKAGPGAAAAKTVSIADVVKAQPKPQAQSEWGGFKVVNKKKKSGRA
ncbi:hypothetical protein D9757_002183 [Collybiopsis confluens]|uniref:GYF domain-containing protein n=1 Tax=Collybiopsis confluens TaxID=2823264 RepID=A0A8H5MG23_9AGAR|nr:hypothetical protein D9757_002183 [Collybiopsis confluens]